MTRWWTPEEFNELQTRHTFLEEQLEDVRSTRRELSRVIAAVDTEIQNVFASAFADVLLLIMAPPQASSAFRLTPSAPISCAIASRRASVDGATLAEEAVRPYIAPCSSLTK